MRRDVPEVRWAELAVEASYADQPHMINECRAPGGDVPRRASRRDVRFVQYRCSRHALASTDDEPENNSECIDKLVECSAVQQ